MDILFLSAYFPPEIGAPSNRAYELTRRWAAAGHRVQVLTGFPNHPTGVVPPSYRAAMSRLVMREQREGVEIVRVWLYPTPNRRAWQRALNYSSFGFFAGLIGPWLKRPNVVVATSPHLLTGLAGWWLGCWFRVPWVLEIRDLWPESIVASDVVREQTSLIRTLRGLAGFLYRRADRIVAVTPPIADILQDRWQVPSERLTVIEHGVDGSRFLPTSGLPWPSDCVGLEGQPVVSYIGTMGMAHGLTTLLKAAEQVAARNPKIQFLLIGEGADKEQLMKQASARSLPNVQFLPQQPWSQIPDFIHRSTICVALLKPGETFQTVMPTKVLEYMACGKPVILAAGGHVRRILQEADAGIAVDPGDETALAEAVLALVSDPARRQRFGENGRRYVLGRFDLNRQAAHYVELLNSLVDS